MELLDDANVIAQRDPHGALAATAEQWKQLGHDLPHEFIPVDTRITALVIAGMGGSALAAGLFKDWLNLEIPVEITRTYDLPAYVGPQTLVIASSFSGNTEETLSCAHQARERGAVTAVTARGGALLEYAKSEGISYVELPQLDVVPQPRMGVFANLRSILQLCKVHNIIDQAPLDELAGAGEWLRDMGAAWASSVPGDDNYAKQIAWYCAGKSPVVYASSLFSSIAYKWKISFNESGKNVAWWDEYPEFNHNEFIGWRSHPIEKPYAVLTLRSSFDHPQIQKRFEISERLLSGLRPAAKEIQLEGDSVIRQMLWGCVLADYTSSYLGILNNVDPVPVDLVEKLKVELVK